MIWPFKKKEPEFDDEPQYGPRVATDEFLYGLQEIAEIYEIREKNNRGYLLETAERLSKKKYFNYEELDQFTDKIRGYIVNALHDQTNAAEIRDWIRSYKYRGRVPKHMREVKIDTPANTVSNTSNTVITNG